MTADAQSFHRESVHVRVVWLAGTRAEALALGPLAMRVRSLAGAPSSHWFINLGEQGTAMQQALDWLGLQPDEHAPLCHPADEPTVRLQTLLERIESVARRRKATHLIFTGVGATAAAAALTCHGRAGAGLWLEPADRFGQFDRLRIEAGYRRIIRACAPAVRAWLWPATPLLPGDIPAGWPQPAPRAVDLSQEIPELRPSAPLALVSVQRREWGMKVDHTGPLARAVTAWAAATPDRDWVVLSNLNARLESPFRALPGRPENLHLVPPQRYDVYLELLRRAGLVLTDSPREAEEATRFGARPVLLGETPGASGDALAIVPDDLRADARPSWLDPIERSPVPLQPDRTVLEAALAACTRFFAGEAVD